MKKILKWTGIVLLSLVLIAVIGSVVLSQMFLHEFEKVYTLNPAPVNIPSDSASIQRGQILSVGCRECHDIDFAGKVFFDDPAIGVLPSSNLTRAAGSETEGYTDTDFVRAIRHGLNKKGNALMVMPAQSYTHLSDHDLGCLIAYLKTLPPVERKFARRKFTFTAQVMAGAGLFGDLFPYKIIDHEKAKNIPAVPVGPSIAYGEYLTRIDGCKECHATNLGGGVSPDPVSPPVPDISKSGNFGKWTLEQFIGVFRTGKTPEGKALDGKFMPFASLGAKSDVEIEAVYRYIASLPAAH